jgi:hypothetical protein
MRVVGSTTLVVKVQQRGLNNIHLPDWRNEKASHEENSITT